MWQPATYVLESFVSWFVNHALIGSIEKRATHHDAHVESILRFLERLPQDDFGAFFQADEERPLPPRWYQNTQHKEQLDFSFPSDCPLGDSKNDLVRGKAFLPKGHSKEHAVVLLHGWITPDHHQSFRVAREFQRYQLPTYMLELPMHMRRTPKGSFSGTSMLDPDLTIFFHALRQAVIDLQKLIRGLRQKGYHTIHLCGISLGAYVASVVASICEAEEAPASLSAVMPLVDIGYTFQHSPMLSSARRLLAHYQIAPEELLSFFQPLQLTQFRPKLSKDRILIVNAAHDRVTYAHKVNELWEAWDRPHMFEEEHGHVSMFFALEPFQRVAAYLGHRFARHALPPRQPAPYSHQVASPRV